MSPTGLPSTSPHGKEIAGCPEALKGAVLPTMGSESSMILRRLESSAGIAVALKGVVGIANTSKVLNALSYAIRIVLSRDCAFA